MSLLYIVKYGHPALREPADPIGDNSDGLQQLIDDMFETMYAAPGVGLAAPQVGVSKRLFVMDPGGNREDEPRDPRVVINPEILEESVEDDLLEEGCLSLPELHGDVYRPLRIRVRYLDRELNAHEEQLSDFPARVFQHEFDHLDGTLFFDKMPLAKRTLLGPALMRIRREAQRELEEIRAAQGPEQNPPFRLVQASEGTTE